MCVENLRLPDWLQQSLSFQRFCLWCCTYICVPIEIRSSREARLVERKLSLTLTPPTHPPCSRSTAGNQTGKWQGLEGRWRPVWWQQIDLRRWFTAAQKGDRVHTVTPGCTEYIRTSSCSVTLCQLFHCGLTRTQKHNWRKREPEGRGPPHLFDVLLMAFLYVFTSSELQ